MKLRQGDEVDALAERKKAIAAIHGADDFFVVTRPSGARAAGHFFSATTDSDQLGELLDKVREGVAGLDAALHSCSSGSTSAAS